MLYAAALVFMVVTFSKLMSLCIFLKGSSKGQTGFFPASYVQVWCKMFLSLCLSVCLSVCLFVCLTVRLSVSVFLSEFFSSWSWLVNIWPGSVYFSTQKCRNANNWTIRGIFLKISHVLSLLRSLTSVSGVLLWQQGTNRGILQTGRVKKNMEP